jgi:hypothetical protein
MRIAIAGAALAALSDLPRRGSGATRCSSLAALPLIVRWSSEPRVQSVRRTLLAPLPYGTTMLKRTSSVVSGAMFGNEPSGLSTAVLTWKPSRPGVDTHGTGWARANS